MKNRTPELSIVLPAYKEAENLRFLLPQLKQTAEALAPDGYEILVIDATAPIDETPAVCQQFGVAYLNRTDGEYYGHAVRTGIRQSSGKYVIFMDADGSHNPNFLPQLWSRRETNDLVIASRYVNGGNTENPAVLIFLSLAVNVIFRLVLSLRCADVSNSFRLYRGDQLRALELECEHFDIVEEILVRLNFTHSGFRIAEVPFTFEKRKAGKTKRQLLLFALGYVAVLWRLHRLKAKAGRAIHSTQ